MQRRRNQGKLKLERWRRIKDETGTLKIKSDEETLKEGWYLDGCYVIKTDLKENKADAELVHDRHKGLTKVGKVFRGVGRKILIFVPRT